MFTRRGWPAFPRPGGSRGARNRPGATSCAGPTSPRPRCLSPRLPAALPLNPALPCRGDPLAGLAPGVAVLPDEEVRVGVHVEHRRLTFKHQGLAMRLTGVEGHSPVQGVL